MEWLKDNAFLAAWLALPIAVFAIYVQNRGKQFRDYDWNWITIYLAFGLTIGITFTKTFDTFSRDFAKWLAMLSFFAICLIQAAETNWRNFGSRRNVPSN